MRAPHHAPVPGQARPRWVRGVGAFVLALGLGCHAAAAWGAEPPVTATYVQPIRSVDRPATVRFVLHNNAAVDARDFRFRWLEPAEAGAFGGSVLSVLHPGADEVVEGNITAAGFEVGDSALLHVEYTLLATRRTLIVKVPIAGTAPPPGADPVTATMTAAEGSLVDYETRRFYLTLTHGGGAPVTVGQIRTRWPSFIRLDSTIRYAPGGEGRDSTGVLAPGQTLVVAFDMALNGPVNPGRHVLLFDVPLEWKRRGTTVRTNKVVSATIPVAVLGESEALQLLSIPSFLFMPGFIILVTAGLFWKWDLFARVRPNFSFPFQPREPEFWVVSVSISIALWLVLAWLTGRNYLESHSASDVAKIWIVALLAGAILFGATGAVNHLYLAWTRGPIQILRTMQRREPGALLAQRRVRIRADDREGLAFVIEPERRNSQSVHLAPPILLTWNDQATGDEAAAARQELEDALASRYGTIAAVVPALEKAVRQRVVTLRWNSTPVLWGPTRVAKSEVRDWDAGREILIEEEPQRRLARVRKQ